MSSPRTIRNLPPDAWFNILIYITDLKTLNRAIQASKDANRAFRQYTKTIVTTVARTEVGPVLPSALLLALVQQEVRKEGIVSSLNVWKNEAIGAFLHDVTEDTASFPSDADWSLSKQVAVNAAHIEICEEFYSRNFCDRTSRYSVLYPDMSERFQKALYRFFLYRLITFGKFHWERRVLPDPYGRAPTFRMCASVHDENMRERKRLEEPRQPSKLQFFLRTLKTDEEKEDFAAAVNILEESFSPWFNNTVSPPVEISKLPSTEYWMELSTLGPVLGHSRWPAGAQKEWFPDVPTKISSREMTRNVCELLEIDSETLGMRHFIGIYRKSATPPPCTVLEKKIDMDPYRICMTYGTQGRMHNAKVYNKTNWGMLYGDMSPQNFLKALLPHKLHDNAQEGTLIAKWSRSLRVPQIVQSIFASAHVRGEEISDDDWICFSCLEAFLRKHGVVWWAERRQQIGYNAPSEDCREGFACNSQRDIAHVGEYNHLCHPAQDSEYEAMMREGREWARVRERALLRES